MDSYRIAIVDDEIGAIRHLKRLLKNDKQIEIAAVYTNSTEALELLPCEKIDIIFLDIMMPVIDGLSLAECFLKKNVDLQIILLTSYKDFSFAQKAISIGVYAYWVKHELRADTIKEKIEDVKKAVISSQQVNRYKKREEISRFLEKPGSSADFLTTETRSRFFSLVYIKQNDEGVQLEPEFLKDFMSLSVKYPFFWSDFITVSNAILCMIGYDNTSIFYVVNTLENSLKSTGLNILVTTPFTLETYTPDLHFKYLEVFPNIFFGERVCLYIDERKLDEIRPDYCSFQDFEDKYFREINEAFLILDEEKIRAVLQTIFHAACIAARNLSAIRYVVNHLYLSFSSYDISRERESIRVDYEQMTLSGIKQFFLNWLKEVVSEAENFDVPSNAKARHIMSYIQSNYNKELHIKTLAQQFHMNGDYLRKLFKLETGMNLSEYISSVRINKAKKLLETGHYKIYQIAEMVGYRSASYFSQAFFHVTGIYPTETKAKRKGEGL